MAALEKLASDPTVTGAATDSAIPGVYASFFGPDPTPMLLTQYFDRFWPCVENRPNTWAIVPRSIAAGLSDCLKFRQCQTAFAIPPRMIFAHTINDPDKNESIFQFLESFRQILQERGFGLLL